MMTNKKGLEGLAKGLGITTERAESAGGAYSQAQKPKIIIVDDENSITEACAKKLSSSYDVKSFPSGEAVVGYFSDRAAELDLVDVAILDFKMPGMDGSQTFVELRKISQNFKCVFHTAFAGEYDPIDILNEHHPFGYVEKGPVIKRLETLVDSAVELREVERMKEKQALIIKDQLEMLKQKSKETIIAIIKTSEAKDPYLANHSETVASVAVEIGKALVAKYGWEINLEDLSTTSLIHDAGKMGTPDTILHYTGNLRDKPLWWEVMKEHPQQTYNIFKELKTLKDLGSIASQHHEKLDGSGYPKGLKGEEIHPYAKIISFADSLEAMTAQRTYREKPFTFDEALEVLGKDVKAGKLDSTVYAALLGCRSQVREILDKRNAVKQGADYHKKIGE